MNQPAPSRRYARLGLAAAFAAALLAGCWGDDDDGDAAATTAVPGSAFVSSDSFISYLRGLAANDTDEPLSLDGMTAPADETSEPIPLG